MSHAVTMVTAANVAQLLRQHGCPRSFAALKVDIDSLDLQVIDAVLRAGFLPAVVMAEINQDVPPPWSFYVTATPGVRSGEGFYGTSLQPLYDLLTRSGFALVQLKSSNSEHNAWFVHEGRACRVCRA